MLKFKRRIVCNPRDEVLETRVRLSGPTAEIRMIVREELNARQRRVITNSFFRHMRSWLDFFNEGTLRHQGSGFLDIDRDLDRMSRWMSRNVQEVPIQDQAIGLTIRMRRLELGLTQVELARRAGVNRSHLVEIEKGSRRPRADTLFKICVALGQPSALANPTRSDIRGIALEANLLKTGAESAGDWGPDADEETD